MIDYQFSDYFDLQKVKKHLRVYFDDDDDDIKDKATQALFMVAQYIDRDVYPAGVDISGLTNFPINMNPAIMAVSMIITSDLYYQRNATVEGTLSKNPIWAYALNPIRRLTVVFNDD